METVCARGGGRQSPDRCPHDRRRRHPHRRHHVQVERQFAFEGEEEAGSPNLEKTLAANKDLFVADLWLMCDGPLYQTRQQSIIFGARGTTSVDITVYGPRTELHSGHYGNWAPNPAMSLARLLTSMKDDDGRVLVEHFYDDVEPLGPVEGGRSMRRPRSMHNSCTTSGLARPTAHRGR
jgi:acetylornithine deacetylase/succinyl-diaminopimelate desuccinylase-like protein